MQFICFNASFNVVSSYIQERRKWMTF